MIAIITLFIIALLAVWRRWRGLFLPLLLSGFIWAGCSYAFIAVLQLPFAWSLCCILLLTAMAALYFHPPGLLCYALPVWLMMPIASLMLTQRLNINFYSSWIIFSTILIYGRFILLRWFNEAWRRMRENQLLIARLDALAHQDPLTQTANRRAMESVLESAVAQQKPFALIMLDVDFFKRYNDHYGHQAGDACLTRVAQALKQSVRHPDDLVARYGGEEFVVILFNAQKHHTEQVAKRIQENLRNSAIVHAASAVSDNVTVSMGIACSAAGQTANETIAQADAALYRAKEAGRNRWSR
jgi:diguanylate cyclase (GGDEF)-like protein